APVKGSADGSRAGESSVNGETKPASSTYDGSETLSESGTEVTDVPVRLRDGRGAPARGRRGRRRPPAGHRPAEQEDRQLRPDRRGRQGRQPPRPEGPQGRRGRLPVVRLPRLELLRDHPLGDARGLR